MVVRFITKRFIGSYDNTEEKLYSYTTLVDNELISFEIIDRPGHFNVGNLARAINIAGRPDNNWTFIYPFPADQRFGAAEGDARRSITQGDQGLGQPIEVGRRIYSSLLRHGQV